MTTLAVTGGSVDLAIDGALISAVGTRVDAGDAMLDASGCTVLPGFVDLQVNGAVGVDLSSAPERIGEVAAFLPQCGVTSFMPTVISSTPAATRHAIEVLHAWSVSDRPARSVSDRPARSVSDRSASCARSLGVHLEGPFLHPDRAGAHPPGNLRPPSVVEAASWTRDAGVAMVTIAPELPGACEVIADLVASGVVVCAGHSTATSCALDAAVATGLRGATHLFNAMGAMSARGPGLAGAVLDRHDVITGLIVDGLHVDPAMVRLAWRVLGPDRIALVTDAMAALGLANGDFVIGQTPVVVGEDGARTVDGVLAGSVLRFDHAVRNLIEFTACSLEQASTSASTTPARLAGRADIGRLAPGCAADVVVLDGNLHVVATVVAGVVVFDPEGRLAWRS